MSRSPAGRPAPRRGTSLLIIAVLALLTAVLLVVFVIRLSRSPQAKVQLGTETFTVGPAAQLATQVAQGGPVLLPPLRGSLILFVQHLGADPVHGWLAFEADRRHGAKTCTLAWQAGPRTFVDPCDATTYGWDGRGLEQYSVVVDGKGKVVVDPQRPTGTAPRPT